MLIYIFTHIYNIYIYIYIYIYIFYIHYIYTHFVYVPVKISSTDYTIIYVKGYYVDYVDYYVVAKNCLQVFTM